MSKQTIFGTQNRFRLVLLVSGLMACLLLGNNNTEAAQIINCTGQPVKIETHDYGSQMSAKKRHYLASGLRLETAINSSNNRLRVFETGYIETLRATQFNLAEEKIYSIIKILTGNWKVTPGKAC